MKTPKCGRWLAENHDKILNCHAGGHGVCYDFPDDPTLIAILENHWAHGKVVSAVCHGPVGLVNIKTPSGEYIVKGRQVITYHIFLVHISFIYVFAIWKMIAHLRLSL